MHYMSKKDVHESEIVLARFEDVCPDKKIDKMSLKAIEDDVHVAFSIIGYHPVNLHKSVEKAIDKMNNTGKLYSVCYNAWRLDE